MSDSAETTETVDQAIAGLYAEAEAQETGRPLAVQEDTVAKTDDEVDKNAATTQDPEGSQGDDGETGSDEQTSVQTDDSGTEPEAGSQPSDNQSQEQETGEQKQPSRKDKKEVALTRSWENAARRHEEAKQKEETLAAREAALIQKEQQIQKVNVVAPDDPLPKYSAGQIHEAISEALEEGDLDTAKNLSKQLSDKTEAIRLARTEGPENPAFQQAREAIRAKVIQSNPDLQNQDTPLFKTASGLLSGPWKDVLASHPAGIAAAVEVAQLQIAASSVPELEARIGQLETENEQLKRSTQLGKTGHTSRSTGKNGKPLSADEEIAALYQDAERMS